DLLRGRRARLIRTRCPALAGTGANAGAGSIQGGAGARNIGLARGTYLFSFDSPPLTLTKLLMSQRLDGIQLRCPPGRIVAEKDAHACRYAEGDDDHRIVEHDGPVKQPGQRIADAQPQRDTDAAAQE